MTDQYNPTEDQISKVLEKTGRDPRKLAIAYLRAQKRARDEAMIANVVSNISDATISAMKGDYETALKSTKKAIRTVGSHGEHESQLRGE